MFFTEAPREQVEIRSLWGLGGVVGGGVGADGPYGDLGSFAEKEVLKKRPGLEAEKACQPFFAAKSRTSFSKIEVKVEVEVE